MTLRLLGVPTSAGAYGPGQEDTPDALRATGLLDELDGGVIDDGNLPVTPFRPDPANPTSQHLDTVVDVATAVRQRVAQILSDNDTAVILGGDCTITLGVVAGAAEIHPDLGLAYFDGDTDLSTPATTRSGILDAMGIAHLLHLNGTDNPLARLGPRTPLLDGTRLALIGFEDHDLTDIDRAILTDRAVTLVPADRLRDNPDTAAEVLTGLGDRPLIVHFDVDAVDSIDCPLAEFPHFNTGVTLDVATQVLTTLCAHPHLVAVVITEANPRRDPTGTHITRLSHSIATALERAPDSYPGSGRR